MIIIILNILVSSSRSLVAFLPECCRRDDRRLWPPDPRGYKSVSGSIGDSHPWLIFWRDTTNKVQENMRL